MSKDVIDWKIDPDKFHKKTRNIIFGVLSIVFFILPQFGIDQSPVVKQIELGIGKIHPAIINVSTLPNYGSRASFLLLAATFILFYYVIHTLTYFSAYTQIKKNVNYFKKFKWIPSYFIVVSALYFGVFFALDSKETLTLPKLINSHELLFFILTSYSLTILITFLPPFLTLITSIFYLKE